MTNSSLDKITVSDFVSAKFESGYHIMYAESIGSVEVYDRYTSFIYLSISRDIIGGLIS